MCSSDLIAITLSYISRSTWLPVNLRQFDLFDPTEYGYKKIFTSLGDLIIRMLLLLWIVIFLRGSYRDRQDVFIINGKIKKWIILFAATLLVLSSSYFIAFIVQSLVEDSKISFDVMDFFTLDRFTIFGFLAISVSLITYFFFN